MVNIILSHIELCGSARWRRRRFDGYTFSGDRLSPNLWRALPLALGNDASQWMQHSPDELERMLEMKRATLGKTHKPRLRQTFFGRCCRFAEFAELSRRVGWLTGTTVRPWLLNTASQT